MSSESVKTAIAKFPLRLMPSVRTTAEAYSKKEGVSLNQFINVAVAEKLAVLQHEDWIANRRPLTELEIDRALELLDKGKDRRPDRGDELPRGYRSLVRRRVKTNQRAKAS
jgi:HicB family